MPLEITVNGLALPNLTEEQIYVALNLKRSNMLLYWRNGNPDVIIIENIVRNIVSGEISKLHFIGSSTDNPKTVQPHNIPESAIFFMSAERGEYVETYARSGFMGIKALDIPADGWSYELVDATKLPPGTDENQQTS